MAKHPLWLAWLACVVALGNTALVGCGDDDGGGDSEPDAGDAGGSGGTGGAGTGGAGTGGTGGSAAITCGSTTCTDPLGGMMLPIPLPITLPAPCCYDEAMGVCGTTDTSGMCQEPAPPAVPDATCPGINVFGMQISGCCVDGQCGTDATLLGMGCQENGQAKMSLDAIGVGGFIMIPDPQPCGGGDDGGTEEDGGS